MYISSPSNLPDFVEVIFFSKSHLHSQENM